MYTFDSRIRYSETDSEGKLTMASLINYFQDCSTFQSEDLGLGVGYLKEVHMVWVLSSWQIVVERYPALGERVTVGTLPYTLKGFLGYRNFFLKDEKGEYLAKANSLWSLLDTRTNKPTAIPESMTKGYRLEERLEMAYAPRKITVGPDGVLREPVVVKQHHLDTNHHVNNQQFIDIAMDYLPEGFAVKQVRAEYKKQAFLGDILMPRVSQTADSLWVTLENQEGSPYVVAEFQRRS
ncbi:MAG: acyl-[acyl-carrier-protein] thioesterase [Lachnospiraceae bacterium]|nr:acyl-[acyl-carrier-protein] thioesterase [Lachnospiraceae bacterium]